MVSSKLRVIYNYEDAANCESIYANRVIGLKIKKKYEHVLFTFFMALGMSCFISFVMMLINFGFSSLLLAKWLTAWPIAFALAFPSAYFLPRGIRKLMKKITFVESE